MLDVRKGTASVSIALNAGIVPTVYALSGRMVPREAIAAFIVAECARSDSYKLRRLVDMYKTSDDNYDDAFNDYCMLNPVCITIEYDGRYIKPTTVKYLTSILVKNIASGKLSLN